MWPGEHPPACFQLGLHQSGLAADEGHAGDAGVALASAE